jgi:hypothetical protein
MPAARGKDLSNEKSRPEGRLELRRPSSAQDFQERVTAAEALAESILCHHQHAARSIEAALSCGPESQLVQETSR